MDIKQNIVGGVMILLIEKCSVHLCLGYWVCVLGQIKGACLWVNEFVCKDR
jgi:hypothetical protein